MLSLGGNKSSHQPFVGHNNRKVGTTSGLQAEAKQKNNTCSGKNILPLIFAHLFQA